MECREARPVLSCAVSPKREAEACGRPKACHRQALAPSSTPPKVRHQNFHWIYSGELNVYRNNTRPRGTRRSVENVGRARPATNQKKERSA